MNNTIRFIDKYVEKYKDQFEKATFFGCPISELNSDQLRALVCFLGDQIKENRESFDRERNMYKLFRSKGI